MEENMNYEVENTAEETSLTTEQECSGGGVVLGMVIGAAVTGAVIGAKKLWNKFGPKKNKKMGTISKEEPIDVEIEEEETEEAAK